MVVFDTEGQVCCWPHPDGRKKYTDCLRIQSLPHGLISILSVFIISISIISRVVDHPELTSNADVGIIFHAASWLTLCCEQLNDLIRTIKRFVIENIPNLVQRFS